MNDQLKSTLYSIAKRISYLRKQRGLSQEELAFKANIDRTYIGYIENARHNITLGVLIKIASALEVSLTDLINLSEEINPISEFYSFPKSSKKILHNSKLNSKISIKTELKVYQDDQSFSSNEKKLFQAAKEASKNAYAPYSNFKVGSAVLLSNNEIISGSNQENAVFPLGLCAERVALFSASTKYPKEPIISLALTTQKKLKQEELPVFPCGSCRHSIFEYEAKFNNKIKLFITGGNKKIFVINTVQDILPFAFNRASLNDE